MITMDRCHVGTGSAKDSPCETLQRDSRGGSSHWRTGTGVAIRLWGVCGRSVTGKSQQIDKPAPAPSNMPPTHTDRGSCVSKLVLRRHACTRARCAITISRDVTAAWNGLAPGRIGWPSSDAGCGLISRRRTDHRITKPAISGGPDGGSRGIRLEPHLRIRYKRRDGTAIRRSRNFIWSNRLWRESTVYFRRILRNVFHSAKKFPEINI